MSNTAYFSRGSSFGCTWVWTPGEGEPANLLGTAITSTLKDKCENEYDMDVVMSEDGLSFTTNYVGDTSDWALGQANWDVRFVFPGNPITSSRTFRVIVEETVTKA